MATLYDFTARELTGGREVSLREYEGRMLLVVNTASKCGLTPQFEGLEKLYRDLGPRGFTVLGFPTSQFAKQEFDDGEETSSFCQLNYGVTFPMFEKIDVNGQGAHPLYKWLRSQNRGLFGDAIKWNFTKFLVNGQGAVVKRYRPTVAPEKIRRDIEALL